MYCILFLLFDSVVGYTAHIARMVGRMSEGMRIHISNTTKHLLDKVGGFRCEYRGVLDVGVSMQPVKLWDTSCYFHSISFLIF